MRYVKTLFLVAFAAMAMMAVAVSSASASTLCTNDVNHQAATACGASHGKHVKVGTPINAALSAGQNAVLTVTNSNGEVVRTVTCTTSTVTGSVTNSTTGTGNITGLTFGNCSSPGCEKVSASAPRAGKAFPWAATTATTTAPNGTMTVSGPSGKFTATCSGITATCEYEATSAKVTVNGGAPATVVATAVPLELKSGLSFICGSKADWTAKYTVSTPSSLYLT